MPPWTKPPTSFSFWRSAFDVFCRTAPRPDELLRRLASIVVTRRTGYSEGPSFSLVAFNIAVGDDSLKATI